MLVLCLFAQGLRAQPDPAQEPVDRIEQYRNEVYSLVDFLEYAFNLLGDPTASRAEKDVLIHESYRKVFFNELVQIEDDLVEGREVVLRKSVQAYLKDITFFFREAQFELAVEELSYGFNEEGKLFFIVGLTRHLKALTMQGDTLRSAKQRYIEINLDEEHQLLQVASIYSTRLNEREEMAIWWRDLPLAWKLFFAPKIRLSATLTMDKVLQAQPDISLTESYQDENGDTLKIGNALFYNSLRQVWAMEAIDISGQSQFHSIAPLSKFTRLRRLDISRTPVADLSPLRNLGMLEVLNCAYAAVTDYAPLRYALNLRELFCEHTQLRSANSIGSFVRLEKLYAHHTPLEDISALSELVLLKDLRLGFTRVRDLSALKSLSRLEYLQLSHTQVQDLSPLRGLVRLEQLHIDHTGVQDLGPLSGATGLKQLVADNTYVQSLAPLVQLPALNRVYCDDTPITQTEALAFLQKSPRALLLYQSSALKNWWAKLDSAWQTVFRACSPLDADPGKEQLQSLVRINKLNLKYNRQIKTLEPLRELRGLTELDCSYTGITNLSPLSGLQDLQQLDFSHTQVNSIASLEGLKNLRRLDASHTPLSSLDALAGLPLEWLDVTRTLCFRFDAVFSLPKLRNLSADSTGFGREQALQLLEKNPACLAVYQSAALEAWWQSLGTEWQQLFRSQMPMGAPPSREELHRLSCLAAIEVAEGNQLTQLHPLKALLRLRSLKLSHTRIADLGPLADMPYLETLRISFSPVQDLSPIAALPQLRELDIENTLVSSLEVLSNQSELVSLNLSGTQVKDLKALHNMLQLRRLSCYNTRIKSLKPLSQLANLSLLRCYNTRIPARKIQEFRAAHAYTEVVFY